MSEMSAIGLGGSGLPVESCWVQKVRVAYMNVGRGIVATHDFLETCACWMVRVACVGECCFEKGGRGT